MFQNEDFWVDLIGYLTSLSIDARNLLVNLDYQVFNLLSSHVVFVLNRLLLQRLQLQDAIALLGHHVLRQPKLFKLYLFLAVVAWDFSLTGVHGLLRLLQLFLVLSLVLLDLAEEAAEIGREALCDRLLLLAALLHQVADRMRWHNLADLGWNIGSLLDFFNGRSADYFTDRLKKD